MATKKEKRAAALAKRDEFMQAERARGLEALEAARVAREKKAAEVQAEALKEGLRLNRILALQLVREGLFVKTPSN